MTRRHPDRRTALITAAGIAAVVVAGGFAISANLGILSASSEPRVGALAAAGDLAPTTSVASASSTPPVTTQATTQMYLVENAGSVVLDDADPLAVREVSVNPGWTWTAGPAVPTHVEVLFSDGMRTLLFSATRADDGTVAATVEELTASDASPATVATAPSSHHDDDRDDEHEEHDEHEGRDDDD
jgi:hypothetical protein